MFRSLKCRLRLRSHRTGIVGLPVLVPIFLVTTAIAAVFALVAGAVWAGSRTGRARVLQLAKPILERLDNDPKVIIDDFW